MTLETARLRNILEDRLRAALRTANTLGELRTAVVEALGDLPRAEWLDPVDALADTEPAPDTVRTPDSAPSVDVESVEGREFGVDRSSAWMAV